MAARVAQLSEGHSGQFSALQVSPKELALPQVDKLSGLDFCPWPCHDWLLRYDGISTGKGADLWQKPNDPPCGRVKQRRWHPSQGYKNPVYLSSCYTEACSPSLHLLGNILSVIS